jgi:hypothetical protein
VLVVILLIAMFCDMLHFAVSCSFLGVEKLKSAVSFWFLVGEMLNAIENMCKYLLRLPHTNI